MSELTHGRYVLAVRDLERSVAYYHDVLGFRVTERFEGWAFLERDAVCLMLGHCPETLSPGELGDHSYFAYIEVSKARELHDEFSSNGASFVKAIRDEPWGMREFGIVTIDGHRIMFGQKLNS